MDIDDPVFYIQRFQELRHTPGAGHLALCLDAAVPVRTFGERFLGLRLCASRKEVNHEFPKHTMRQHGQEGHHRQAKVRADVGSLHPAKDGRMTHRIQRRTVDPWVEATDVDVRDLSSFDDHLMVVSDGLRAPSEDSFLQFEEFDEVQV